MALLKKINSNQKEKLWTQNIQLHYATSTMTLDISQV